MRMPIVSFLERPSFLFFRVAIPYLWAENELAHLQLGNESKLTKESCYKIWGHAKRLSQNWSLTIFLEQLTLKIDIFDQAFHDLGISDIPKSHICLEHVKQYIWYTGKPIGAFSEQSFEGGILLSYSIYNCAILNRKYFKNISFLHCAPWTLK